MKFALSDLLNIDDHKTQFKLLKYLKSCRKVDKQEIRFDCFMIRTSIADENTIFEHEGRMVDLIDMQNNLIFQKKGFNKLLKDLVKNRQIKWVKYNRTMIWFRKDLQPIIAMKTFMDELNYEPGLRSSLLCIFHIAQNPDHYRKYKLQIESQFRQQLASNKFNDIGTVYTSKTLPTFVLLPSTRSDLSRMLKLLPLGRKSILGIDIETNTILRVEDKSIKNSIIDEIRAGAYCFLPFYFTLIYRSDYFIAYYLKNNSRRAPNNVQSVNAQSDNLESSAFLKIEKSEIVEQTFKLNLVVESERISRQLQDSHAEFIEVAKRLNSKGMTPLIRNQYLADQKIIAERLQQLTLSQHNIISQILRSQT